MSGKTWPPLYTPVTSENSSDLMHYFSPLVGVRTPGPPPGDAPAVTYGCKWWRKYYVRQIRWRLDVWRWIFATNKYSTSFGYSKLTSFQCSGISNVHLFDVEYSSTASTWKYCEHMVTSTYYVLPHAPNGSSVALTSYVLSIRSRISRSATLNTVNRCSNKSTESKMSGINTQMALSNGISRQKTRSLLRLVCVKS